VLDETSLLASLEKPDTLAPFRRSHSPSFPLAALLLYDFVSQDKQIACHCELGGNGGIRFEADLSL
jgi:hypothetical protein